MYDITIIGNAPIDILFQVDDALLKTYKLKKGDWQRLDVDVFDALMAELNSRGIQGELIPGGSGANTAWHLGRMGHNVFFAGIVGDDRAGNLFHDSMTDAGVDMTPPTPGLRSFVLGCLITPDGERTFVSDGRCPPFGPEHLPVEVIATSRYLLLEGYLLGESYPTLAHAADLAAAHGAGIILTLAAPSFVTKHFDQLATLLRHKQTCLFFANDKELAALQDQMGNIADPELTGQTLNALSLVEHVITHGAKGAELFTGGISGGLIKPAPVAQVVDATGAGDAFAAGFLHVWLTKPFVESTALKAGHTLAGKVIAHIGGRPNVTL